MPDSVIPLREASARPLAQVGGKAQALGRLIQAGAPVPPGFVVPPGAGLAASARAISAAHRALGAEFVAVRSSAAGEDSDLQSWAGQFDTYLYVPARELTRRIAACRASGTSGRAQAYSAAAHSMPVAVIIQAMVPADVAGVLFTANPVTGDRAQIMIEAVFGLGELLVSGAATPDNYLLDKATGRTVSESIARKESMLIGSPSGTLGQPVPAARQDSPALSLRQRTELAQLSSKLEAKFGHPLDIEWAYAKEKLFILQARPITTLPGARA